MKWLSRQAVVAPTVAGGDDDQMATAEPIPYHKSRPILPSQAIGPEEARR